MDKSTQEKIHELTLDMMKKFDNLTKYPLDDLKKQMPFHAIFFSDEALPAVKDERTIVTKIGTQYFPKLAKIIADEKYSNVKLNHAIIQEIDSAKLATIDSIVNDLRGHRTKPSHFNEIEKIMSSTSKELQTSRVIADVYIGDHEEGEVFIELKSPRPNLDVCETSKRKILTFYAMNMENNNKCKGWLGLTYNPFGEGNPYEWSVTRSVMDMNDQVLIGSALWDRLGGKGTFNEILKIGANAKLIHNRK